MRKQNCPRLCSTRTAPPTPCSWTTGRTWSRRSWLVTTLTSSVCRRSTKVTRLLVALKVESDVCLHLPVHVSGLWLSSCPLDSSGVFTDSLTPALDAFGLDGVFRIKDKQHEGLATFYRRWDRAAARIRRKCCLCFFFSLMQFSSCHMGFDRVVSVEAEEWRVICWSSNKQFRRSILI